MRSCLTPLALIFAACFWLSCSRITGVGVRSFVEEPFPAKLSEWRLFLAPGPGLKPNKGVVPYDLNTPLFSDYSHKYRFVWMPEGSSAIYHEEEPFEFPVGAILAKSFAYPVEGIAERERLIETRLLVRGKNGWVSLPYVWNEEQTEATLEIAGGSTQVSYPDRSGRWQKADYNIPNTNECAQCHEKSKMLSPIGPKARNLNRDYRYTDGIANQLAYWTKLGYLKDAPQPGDAPKAPVWNDPSTGSLEARARAYLDNNCAHCHQSGGSAGYTAFLLNLREKEPRRLGYCKNPNSAGYSGNLAYDLVPGKPDQSILIYRMRSTRAKEMMPEIGRSQVHGEGVALISEWVASLKGNCD